jgi:hypothetical protein
MGICILGMGDCTSESSVDINSITDNNTVINNVIKNNIEQSCNIASGQGNTINIVGSDVKNLTASQKNTLQSLCVMQSILKSNVDLSIQQKLLDQIKGNVESKGVLLGGAPASSKYKVTSETKNRTSLNNEIANEAIKDCLVKMKQNNLLNIIGSSVEASNFDQVNESFLKCMSTHSNDTGIIISDVKEISKDTSSDVKAKGGDVLVSAGDAVESGGRAVSNVTSSWFSGVTGLFLIPIVICISAIVILVFLFIQNPDAAKSLIKEVKSTAV